VHFILFDFVECQNSVWQNGILIEVNRKSSEEGLIEFFLYEEPKGYSDQHWSWRIVCISVVSEHIFNVVSSLFYWVFHVSESRIGLTWWTLQMTGLWGQCERQYASPTPSLYIFLKISKGRRYSYASTYGGAWYSMFVASAEQATDFPIYCSSICSWHLLTYVWKFELALVVQGIAATMTTFHEQGLMVRSEINLLGEALLIVGSAAG
jgi:hypothetical protein